MEEQNSKKNSFRDLPLRILTGTLLASLVLICLIQGELVFTLFVALCAIVMVHEWRGITSRLNRKIVALGIPYILLPCISLIGLRIMYFPELSTLSIWPTLYVIAIVAATDTGAYIAGRAIGGPKLAPKISPGKTWAGLIGGMGCAVLASVAFQDYVILPNSLTGAIAVGMVLAIVSQLGDLFESWIKRRAKVKDSGTLLPGHGGLLDRVDGLLFAAPVYFLMNLLAGAHIL